MDGGGIHRDAAAGTVPQRAPVNSSLSSHPPATVHTCWLRPADRGGLWTGWQAAVAGEILSAAMLAREACGLTASEMLSPIYWQITALPLSLSLALSI